MWRKPLHGGARSGLRPGSGRATDVTTKCTKDGCKPGVATCMSGADLSAVTSGKVPSESQPSSRTGENPPYGMRGGIEETSASCEARSAPRSYPTGGGRPPPATRWARGNSRPYREKAFAHTTGKSDRKCIVRGSDFATLAPDQYFCSIAHNQCLARFAKRARDGSRSDTTRSTFSTLDLA